MASKDEEGFGEMRCQRKRDVFCNILFLNASEFYGALQAGAEATYKIEIHAQEYQGEQFAEFEGKRYKISRLNQSKNSDNLELILFKAGAKWQQQL